MAVPYRLLLCILLIGSLGSLSGQLLDENFDGPVFPPAGWAEIEQNGVWQLSGDGVAGSDAATSTGGNFFNPNFTNTLFSSAVALVAGVEYTLEFSANSFFEANLNIHLGTTQNDLGTTSALATYTERVFSGNGLSGYYVELVTFTPPATGTYYLQFVHLRNPENPASGNLRLDDILLYVSPDCPKPTDVTVTTPANTTGAMSVELAWTERGTATQWTVAYSEDEGFNPESEGSTMTVTTNPATISGLTPNTDYTFYVRADCTGPDQSEYSPNPAVGLTDCASIPAPYTESAEDTSSIRRCWEFRNANDDNSGWQILFGNDGQPARTGENAFEFQPSFFGVADPHNDYLISPPLLLAGDETLEFYYSVRGDVTFELLLSDLTNATSNFSNVLAPSTTYSNSAGYVRESYDLSNYSGTVWLAWRVTATGGDGDGEFNFALDDISVLAPPPNEDCPDAQVLTEGEMVSGRTGRFSSTGVTGACGGNPDDDVWFTLSVANTNVLPLTLTNDDDASLVLEVFTGATCNALSSLLCGTEGTNFFAPPATGTYYIRVYDSGQNFARNILVDDQILAPFTLVAGGIALPVTLESFTAEKVGKANRLTWETVAERNTAHFAVETSTDGETWTELAAVTAAGNSEAIRQYQFLDPSPEPVSYYRIRTQDFDGTSSISRILLVRRTAHDQPATHQLIFENPIVNILTVRVPTLDDTPAILRIIDVAGREIYSRSLFPNADSEQVQIDLSGRPTGIYFVEWRSGSERYIERFLKK